MPDIEPFKFQKSTNIEEHNQMKDKINEMVEVINDIDLENLPKQIGALETEVATQGNEIDALEVTVDAIPNTYAKKTEIPDVSDFITEDALTPYAKTADVDNADISGIDASIANGEITIKLTRPDGDMSDSIDCPFIQTATLIPTSTARAFKIRFTYTDGTQYDTNEFVIPEGGGTDVSVTGVTVGDGTAPNSFKVTIQLSDTTTIGSNDYVIEFPENINTYPTTLTGSLSGNVLTLTIGLNNGSSVQGTVNLGALLTGYATTSYVDSQVATKLDKTTADGYYQPKGNYAPAGDYVTEPAVETLSAEIINGNTLKIDVNAKSTQVTLPSSQGSELEFINTYSEFYNLFNSSSMLGFVVQLYGVSSPGNASIMAFLTTANINGIGASGKLACGYLRNTTTNAYMGLITAINVESGSATIEYDSGNKDYTEVTLISNIVRGWVLHS